VRPLNLGETLDASIKIVRAHWRTLATIMVVVALPLQLLDLLIVTSTTDVYEVGTSFVADSTKSATRYGDENVYLGGQIAVQLLGVLGYLLGMVACYRVIAGGYMGRSTTAGASLSFAAARFGATLWLAILLVTALLPAVLFFVVPGVWLAVAWAVAFPVMLVEGHGGVAALKRSFALVHGRWWATFGRFVVGYILVVVVTAVITSVVLLPALEALDETSFAALVVEHLVSFVVSLIATPFIAALATLVYFDLRGRKEGFDPAVLADGLGAAPEPVSSFGGWTPPVAPEPSRRPGPAG
jgi:hypothetical protein